MRPLGWVRRWPITTMLVAVILAQTVVIFMFAAAIARVEESVDESAEQATRLAAEAVEAAEVRAAADVDQSEARLRRAMECLTGMLLIPPPERTDDRLVLVCPPDLIEGARARLGP